MFRRWFLLSLLGVALVGGIALTVDELSRPSRLNVLVLTVESARVDALSPALTPNVMSLAESEGIRFTRHYAVSGWTASNIVSILSGLSPIEHGVHTRGESLAPAWPTALEALRADGWRVTGLQPFMVVDVFKNLGLEVEPGVDLLYWLAGRAADRQPFVLWYHYVDTHLPYAPSAAYMPDWRYLLDTADPAAESRLQHVLRDPVVPAGAVAFQPSDRPAIEALYQAGFREFDDWFRRLWQFLDQSGLRRNTVVVLTADHGEELLERGEVGHASTTRRAQLHEEIVRLPLIVWHPDSAGRPSRIDWATDHLDVLPTILDWLGRESELVLEGRTLTEPPGDRAWMAMTSMAGYAEPAPDQLAQRLFARRQGDWKLILRQDGTAFTPVGLYNLSTDPEERVDLSAPHATKLEQLKAGILASIAGARRPRESAQTKTIVGPTPEWVYPPRSGSYSYDDANGRFHLDWTGPTAARYIIQYQAGEGLFRIDGELEVTGNRKDFGEIDRRYWQTWITAYSPYRVRVGYDSESPNWSEWIELQAR